MQHFFYLAGFSEDLKECYAMAKVHQNGDTYRKVIAIREQFKNEYLVVIYITTHSLLK